MDSIDLLVLYGFFPTAPGFVRLPQLDYYKSEAERNIGFHSNYAGRGEGAVECKLWYQNEYRIRITITT